MNDTRKKWTYWGVYFILIVGGAVMSVFKILLIMNTAVFLLGLMWVWNGFSLLLKVNPYYAQQYGRKSQLGVAAAFCVLGVVWIGISFTALSNRALPMIFVSVPFIIILILIRICNKGMRN